MSKSHIRLVSRPENGAAAIKQERVNGKVIFTYDDSVIIGRRRALTGRPAGTECGNSCTCS